MEVRPECPPTDPFSKFPAHPLQFEITSLYKYPQVLFLRSPFIFLGFDEEQNEQVAR